MYCIVNHVKQNTICIVKSDISFSDTMSSLLLNMTSFQMLNDVIKVSGNDCRGGDCLYLECGDLEECNVCPAHVVEGDGGLPPLRHVVSHFAHLQAHAHCEVIC